MSTATIYEIIKALPEGKTPVKDSDWWSRAACLNADPELFFPVGHNGPARRQIAEAKSVCFQCPIASMCLNWALNTGQDFGIWGGLGEDERRSLSRRGYGRKN